MNAFAYPVQVVGAVSAVLAWLVVVPILDLVQQDEPEVGPMPDLLHLEDSEATIIELFPPDEIEAA